jgi:hypothetical protein
LDVTREFWWIWQREGAMTDPPLDRISAHRALRSILTITDNTDNRMFGHVFEDMEDPGWRERIGCGGWNEVLKVGVPSASRTEEGTESEL